MEPNNPRNVELHVVNHIFHTDIPNGTTGPSPHANHELNQSIEQETNKHPNRWIAFGWLLWHTFDFITDVILGIEWQNGIKTTQPETKFQCADKTNDGLRMSSSFLLLFSLIGYLLYLYDTYRQNISLKANSDAKWNCLKLAKLILEDLGSIIIISIVTLSFFQMTIWTALTLLVSALSFMFMMAKQAIYNPCKRSEGCCHKCGACICCLLLFAVFLVLILFGGIGATRYAQTDETRVIMIGNICYRDNDNTANNREYEHNVNLDIWCYYLSSNKSRVICSTRHLYSYDDKETAENTTVVQFQSCKQMMAGKNMNQTICYDSISMKLNILG
eukprot:278667_1